MSVHISLFVHPDNLGIKSTLCGIYALLMGTFLNDVGCGRVLIYDESRDVLSLKKLKTDNGVLTAAHGNKASRISLIIMKNRGLIVRCGIALKSYKSVCGYGDSVTI